MRFSQAKSLGSISSNYSALLYHIINTVLLLLTCTVAVECIYRCGIFQCLF